MDWSEALIQNIVFKYAYIKRHNYIAPNNCPCSIPGEMDMLSVTPAGFLHEYEIKLSRSDYKRDFRKNKHRWYKECHTNSEWREKLFSSVDQFARQTYLPNYYHFVAPQGLIEAGELPDYAGLFTVSRSTNGRGILISEGRYHCKVEKKAPRMHSAKTPEQVLKSITGNLMFSYWQSRIGFQEMKNTAGVKRERE